MDNIGSEAHRSPYGVHASRARLVANFAGFQAGWFACALSAGAGFPLAGPVVVASILGLHLTWCRNRRSELALLGCVFAIGGGIDTAQWLLGVSIAPIPDLPKFFAPLWFATMYANFAATLRYSLAWLGARPWLAAIFGAVGGPMTYRGGAVFDAIVVREPEWISLVVLAVVWGLLTPALFALEDWLSRHGPGAARFADQEKSGA